MISFIRRAIITREPHLDTTLENNRQTVFQFWRKRSVQYLSSLQQQNKWRTENKQPAPDIVIIKEANSSLMCWQIARITQTFDGYGSIVHFAKLKAQIGSIYQNCQKPDTLLFENNPNKNLDLLKWFKIEKNPTIFGQIIVILYRINVKLKLN